MGGFFGGGFRARGTLKQGRQRDAEEVAEWAQGAAGGFEDGRRGGGEGGQGLRIAQEVFEVRAVGGDAVAEGDDQPRGGGGS